MSDIHEIIGAKWIKGYAVQITFNDLRKGTVDLKKYLGRGIFKELTKIENFKRFKVDAEMGTLSWPNGADIAPEVLYQDAFAKRQSNRLSKAA